MNKIEPRTLTGFMELLPNEQILFNQMMDKISMSYESFGFLPIDTPIIELAEVLLAKAGGETEKQIYEFKKGDTDLALRFDLTVPLAKYIAINYGNLSFPFRRYQVGKVYRGERPQKGRFREFYQCDIDVIGDGELGIINDAEMPRIIYTTVRNLGFEDFTIYINNRKILNGLFAELELSSLSVDIMRIIDKLDKIGEENVRYELEKLEISEEKINKIFEFLNIKGTNEEIIKALSKLEIKNELFKLGLEELETVVKYVKVFEVPDENFKIDLTIARGLDYYTGTVYETFLNEYREIGSICSGGRYDNLSDYYTDKKLPGVGVSIGLTRLFYILNELGLIKSDKKSISDVLILPAEEENVAKSIEISNVLRENKINVQVYLNDKKLKAKFKYANKLEVPYVIVVGEEEEKTQKYALKNMETGEQEVLTIEEIVARIK